MKILRLILVAIYLAVLFYLLIPSGQIPPLPNSYRSIEPGDNGGVKGIVFAYYTNLSREEIRSFYWQAYAHSTLFNIPIPTYLLNHPPEYALQTIIDTIHSNSFEELVQPLRQSLYISGWEPALDKKYQKNDPKAVKIYQFDGQDYKKKVILYQIKSPIGTRLLIYHLVWLLTFVLYKSTRKVVTSSWTNH